MKKILLLFCTTIIANQFIAAQVAINTDGTTPNSSAMLDIKSTSKGLLTPRMTTAQRTSIASPATGLMVYDTDVNKFFFYALGSWIEMGTGSATNYWTLNGSHISNNNGGNVGIGVSEPTGTLDVARGLATGGTAVFRGTTYASNFNFGTNEDTYIRGGKDGSNVIINDGSLGNVGIGTSVPLAPLHINKNTDELLRLQGVNPYMQLSNSGGAVGYIQAFGQDLFLGTNNGNATGTIKFYNNNVANMTILPNGNVGLGTTNPQARLHVNNTGEALRLSGFNSFLSVYDNSGNSVGYFQNNSGSIDIGTFVANTNGELRLKTKGQQGLTVQSDGRVRVGSVPGSINYGGGTIGHATLTVTNVLGFKSTSGDQVGEWGIYYLTGIPNGESLDFLYNGGRKAYVDAADGSWNSLSDIRLKENFENYKSVLSGIKKLDVLTYHYKSDKLGRRSFGLVAQNLKQYFPELVSGSEDNGNYLGISYGKTGVLAIKAIQEQQVIIEEQQKKIDELERRLSMLENKLR